MRRTTLPTEPNCLTEKKKGKGYKAAKTTYTRQTRDQKLSEVTADWHELMIPQRTMRPSTARTCESGTL